MFPWNHGRIKFFQFTKSKVYRRRKTLRFEEVFSGSDNPANLYIEYRPDDLPIDSSIAFVYRKMPMYSYRMHIISHPFVHAADGNRQVVPSQRTVGRGKV